MSLVAHANQSGLDLHEDKRIKQSARAASTANVSLSAPGSTLDGVTLVAGDRILLKDQTTASQNGLYTWSGAAVALVRTNDANAATLLFHGFKLFVREGGANALTYWTFTTTATVTLETTSLSFAKDGAGGGSVTSVAVTVPSDLSVGGSPITSSGTIAITANTQSANTVKAGPTTGAAAAPTYRALVSADLPSAPTVSGEITASDFKASGLTGATAASRHVGATAAGAPASGTFVAGDYVIDQTGKLWICTTAGTPGTWSQVSGSGGGSGGVGSSGAQSNSLIADVTITTAGTFYDGPSLTLGAGQWLLVGTVTLVDTTAAAKFTAKLWDGSTGSGHELDSGEQSSGAASQPAVVSLMAVVTPTGSTAYKISATSANSTNGKIKADTPDSATTPHTASTLVAIPVPPVAMPYINVQDQKTQNTGGGSFTSGAWQTRNLNIVVSDTAGLSSLSANQVTLPAGTYRCSISAPAVGVDHHQLRLQNITDTSTLLTGTSEYASNSVTAAQTRSWALGKFTLSASKVLEVQHRCTTTHAATDGMGSPANLTTEVYTVAEFWKEG